MKEGTQNDAHVSVALEPGCGHAVDKGWWRVVGDEADGELSGHEARGGGASGEGVEELQAFALAAARNGCAEEVLVTGLMAALVIEGGTAESRTVDGPAAEDLGDLGDIGLGVAGAAAAVGGGVILRDLAADAEGVQLQQLAGVIFVETAITCCRLDLAAGEDDGRAPGPAGRLGVGADALGVVEVDEHGGTRGNGGQEGLKVAEGVVAYGVALVGGKEVGLFLVFA